MTNLNFAHLTDEEKQHKFRTTLRNKTDNRLHSEEIDSLMFGINLQKQYSVNVYSDPDEFRLVLTVPKGYRGRTVLGQVLAGNESFPGDIYNTERAAAIITREIDNENGLHQIHIFIPPERAKKGLRYEQQRSTAAHRA